MFPSAVSMQCLIEDKTSRIVYLFWQKVRYSAIILDLLTQHENFQRNNSLQISNINSVEAFKYTIYPKGIPRKRFIFFSFYMSETTH